MYANNHKFGVRDEVPLSLSAPKPVASPTPSAESQDGRARRPRRAASVHCAHSSPNRSSVLPTQTKFSTPKPGKNPQPLPSQQNSTRNEPGMNPEYPGINPEMPGNNPENPGMNPEQPGIFRRFPSRWSPFVPLHTLHTLHTLHRLHTSARSKTPTKTNNCTLCTLFLRLFFCRPHRKPKSSFKSRRLIV
jgi:hypothetical protein